jgi:N-acetylglucosaminyldiphosphoundecaprenol N-acetyl-beta-D-mannosaminyltransferase
VAAAGLAKLAERFPGFEWRAEHGYIDDGDRSATTQSVITAIAEFNPHLLFVGMGMPRQELWIARNRKRLATNVILPCGAAIDYVAGVVPTPPRWLGALGAEWLFRLATEPRRLAYRYLIEPWALAGPLLRALLRRLAGRYS